MMQYGDEIGMGDDLSLPERECARTPMQWTSERHGGFSRAETCVRPVIADDTYGYQTVNVADQRRDPQSLLNWSERRIRMRKECRELTWGDVTILRTDAPEVLVLRYDWRGVSMITLHNFSDRRQSLRLDPRVPRGDVLMDVFDDNHSRADASGSHQIALDPYAHRWLRVGGADNVLDRADF
jgi:maltose alpha-D-glucosyltransferase/alpha-amylase